MDKRISIHAPREGSDRTLIFRQASKAPFLSTLPARGATNTLREILNVLKISIHAPREGSDEVKAEKERISKISIHAPREGSDPP